MSNPAPSLIGFFAGSVSRLGSRQRRQLVAFARLVCGRLGCCRRQRAGRAAASGAAFAASVSHRPAIGGLQEVAATSTVVAVWAVSAPCHVLACWRPATAADGRQQSATPRMADSSARRPGGAGSSPRGGPPTHAGGRGQRPGQRQWQRQRQKQWLWQYGHAARRPVVVVPVSNEAAAAAARQDVLEFSVLLQHPCSANDRRDASAALLDLAWARVGGWPGARLSAPRVVDLPVAGGRPAAVRVSVRAVAPPGLLDSVEAWVERTGMAGFVLAGGRLPVQLAFGNKAERQLRTVILHGACADLPPEHLRGVLQHIGAPTSPAAGTRLLHCSPFRAQDGVLSSDLHHLVVVVPKASRGALARGLGIELRLPGGGCSHATAILVPAPAPWRLPAQPPAAGDLPPVPTARGQAAPEATEQQQQQQSPERRRQRRRRQRQRACGRSPERRLEQPPVGQPAAGAALPVAAAAAPERPPPQRNGGRAREGSVNGAETSWHTGRSSGVQDAGVTDMGADSARRPSSSDGGATPQPFSSSGGRSRKPGRRSVVSRPTTNGRDDSDHQPDSARWPDNGGRGRQPGDRGKVGWGTDSDSEGSTNASTARRGQARGRSSPIATRSKTKAVAGRAATTSH